MTFMLRSDKKVGIHMYNHSESPQDPCARPDALSKSLIDIDTIPAQDQCFLLARDGERDTQEDH